MKTLERFISSSVTTIVLLLIYAFGLAIATFIEKYHGTAAAKAMIYYSPVFFLLQFLLVANFVAIVIKHQLLKRRRWGLMVIPCRLYCHPSGRPYFSPFRRGRNPSPA